MGRGRRGGEEGVGKGVEDGGKHKEGGLVSDPLRSPPRVRLAGCWPGPLAKRPGAAPAQWPAHAMQTLPPLALGGMGGDALKKYRFGVALSF